MKRTTTLLSIIFCASFSICIAQKPKVSTGVAITPNNGGAKILPDLAFDLIPALSSGGNAYEAVAGIPDRIKIPLRFIVKNIGNATSKSCKVQLYIRYQGIRTFTEIEHGNVPEGSYNRMAISEPMELQAIEKGKDVLRNHAFVFTRFPEEAWGKRVKIEAEIINPGVNSEITKSNNSSTPFEFDLVK
jgi:hypothetical protein